MQQPPNPYPPNPQQQWQQPSTPSQQPPFPPQPFQSSMPPTQKKSNKHLWLILAALILLLALIIGVASQIHTQDQAPKAQSTSVTQQPALQPTTNPASLPTLQPAKDLSATHGKPQLGGPVSDFIGTYGKPDSRSAIQQKSIIMHFLPSQSGVDGLIVAAYPHAPTDLAANVTLQAQNGSAQAGPIGWAINDAKNRCLAFAPADAHFVKEYAYTNTIGFDMVYTSAQLARSFPASAFVDNQQKQIPAGTFDIQYLYTIDGKYISFCDLAIGAQQTTYNYGRNH